MEVAEMAEEMVAAVKGEEKVEEAKVVAMVAVEKEEQQISPAPRCACGG